MGPISTSQERGLGRFPLGSKSGASDSQRDEKKEEAGLLLQLREQVAAACCSSVEVGRIVSLQSCARQLPLPYLDRLLRWYFSTWSASATGIVFIQLFPFWFSMGEPRATVHLACLMMLCQVITSYVKDTVQLPRPPSPPVVKTGGTSQKIEYGLPSGHCSGAVVLAFINATLAMRIFSVHPLHAAIAGVLYVAHVAFSRIYLGMHWIADVVCGLLNGGLVVLLYATGPLERLLDHWMALGPQLGPAHLGCIAVFVALLALHPAPDAPCPCFVDSVRFVGAGLGAIVGAWPSDPTPFMTLPTSGLHLLARSGLTMCMMVIVEMVVKYTVEYLSLLALPPAVLHSMVHRWWTVPYVAARLCSHVAFAATCCYGARHFLPAITG